MASNLKYPAALRNTMLDTITTRAGNSALLKIYDGTQPATADTAITSQNLLVTLTCNVTFAPASSGGVLTLNAITSANVSSTGTKTATWFRLTNSAGTTTVMDGSVSTSGADLNLNTVSLTNGNSVAVSSFTVTAPQA